MYPCDDLHVHPLGDLIEHELTETCPCGPAAKPVPREDGSIGWLMIHNSLDGRELNELPAAIKVTTSLDSDAARANILAAFNLKAWQAGLEPPPWHVRARGWLRRALRVLNDIIAAASWPPGYDPPGDADVTAQDRYGCRHETAPADPT